MALLWLRTQAGWSEPEEHWRNAKPSMFGKKPDELFGKVHDLDHYFGTGSKRPTPWPAQSRRKDLHDYDADLVAREVRKEPELHEVDPRILRSSQPDIIRAAVSHYMDPKQEEHGRTYESGHNPGNSHPTVYVHENGDHVILSGHHRAAKALFKGEMLRARIIRGGRPKR